MDESLNPWLAVPSQPPYALLSDSNEISAFNSKARDIYRLQLNVMPEPFVGIATAPVVLLGLNPGFDDEDPEVHARPGFQALLRNNYAHGSSDYPFYFLNPTFESPGRQWWETRLRCLRAKFETIQLARSVFCVEYFPYPSRKFGHTTVQVPSQVYGFGLVRSAIARGAVVVIMRARKLWMSKVPELSEYSRAFTLNSSQNVVVSPRNCAGFDAIVSAIHERTVHR
jgi:hypothetical protein